MLKSKAYTLLELMITLLLVATLSSVSLPGFKRFSEKKIAQLTMLKMAKLIELAKSTAITSSSTVTICRSLDGEQCGGKWQDGVIVFTDGNADRKINQDDELVRFLDFSEFKGEIKWRAFQNRQYLQITNLGFTRYQNGNFTFCPTSGDAEVASQLIINRTARIRYAADSNGDGIKEDSQGRPIHC